MLVLPAAIGTFLLVNLLCACVALGVGFAAGVWFFGAKMAKPEATTAAKKQRSAQAEAVAAKRASGACVHGHQPRGRFGPRRRERRRRPRGQDEGDLRRPGRHRS